MGLFLEDVVPQIPSLQQCSQCASHKPEIQTCLQLPELSAVLCTPRHGTREQLGMLQKKPSWILENSLFSLYLITKQLKINLVS